MRPEIIFNFMERDFRISISYRTAFAGRLMGLVFLLGIFYYISLSTDKPAYFPYILIGLAYTAIIRNSLFFLSNRIENEQISGTIGYLFTSPFSTMEYLLGTSIYGLIMGWIEALVYIIAGIFIFNTPFTIDPAHLVNIIPAVLFGTLSLWGIGIIAASITLVWKKGSSLSWLFTAGVIFSGNVFFQSDLLPEWFAWISRLNPAKYSLDIIRHILSAGAIQPGANDYIILIVLSFVFLGGGILSFKTALKRVKKKGDLEHF
ncbi:MAG: ABC transporter permease [Elusimicrobiota bacterium]